LITLLAQSQEKTNTGSQMDMDFKIIKERMKSVSAGKTMPEGIVYDLEKRGHSLNTFKGKYLVIDFWATWCEPCLKEAPAYKKFKGKYKNSNIEFISVSIDRDFEHWKKFIKENKWQGKHYWFGMNEPEDFFSFLYSEVKMNDASYILIRIPKYVLISPEGKILNNSDLRPGKPGFETELLKYIQP